MFFGRYAVYSLLTSFFTLDRHTMPPAIMGIVLSTFYNSRHYDLFESTHASTAKVTNKIRFL